MIDSDFGPEYGDNSEREYKELRDALGAINRAIEHSAITDFDKKCSRLADDSQSVFLKCIEYTIERQRAFLEGDTEGQLNEIRRWRRIVQMTDTEPAEGYSGFVRAVRIQLAPSTGDYGESMSLIYPVPNTFEVTGDLDLESVPVCDEVRIELATQEGKSEHYLLTPVSFDEYRIVEGDHGKFIAKIEPDIASSMTAEAISLIRRKKMMILDQIRDCMLRWKVTEF